MMRTTFTWYRYGILALLLVSTACATAAPSPTPVPTNTPIPPSATPTVKPTATPKPSATPNIAATQEAEADQATLQAYMDSGYISSTKGTLYELVDATQEVAQKNSLFPVFAGYKDATRNFVAWVDMEWSSAGPVNYPEYSGCGFGFRMKDNFDSYTTMVTNDSILVTWCEKASLGNYCGRVGKTRGKGTVKFPNPAKAHFTFIVNDVHAFALVDEQLIAEYTLFQEKLTDPGYFMYAMVSGTNRDYGTRCSFTNGKMWVPEE